MFLFTFLLLSKIYFIYAGVFTRFYFAHSFCFYRIQVHAMSNFSENKCVELKKAMTWSLNFCQCFREKRQIAWKQFRLLGITKQQIYLVTFYLIINEYLIPSLTFLDILEKLHVGWQFVTNDIFVAKQLQEKEMC